MDMVFLSAVNCESDPPDVVYLPVDLKVLNSPEHFHLQRTDSYLPGNASLSSHSETLLFPHHRVTTKPTIQAAYLPFTAHQVMSLSSCGGGNSISRKDQNPLPLLVVLQGTP